MKKIDISQFKLINAVPARTKALAFSVGIDGTIRINGKLIQKLQAKHINILSGPDGTVILLRAVSPDVSEACHVSKDGKVHIPDLMKTLRELAINLPARYVVEWNEDEEIWQGELDMDFSFQMRIPNNGRPRSKKGKNSSAEL